MMRNQHNFNSNHEAHVFMDRYGLPCNGELTHELTEAVRKSHFMWVVVGESYPRSEWCGKELAVFMERFGGNRVEALKHTFVLVVAKASLASNWGEHLEQPTRAIYHECFDKESGQGLPCMVETDDGTACEGLRFTRTVRPMVATMAKRSTELINKRN